MFKLFSGFLFGSYVGCDIGLPWLDTSALEPYLTKRLCRLIMLIMRSNSPCLPIQMLVPVQYEFVRYMMNVAQMLPTNLSSL